MAIFGFVYLWYLMVVLLLEIWFDYRPSMVAWSNEKKGVMKWVYKILTLGVNDISPGTVNGTENWDILLQLSVFLLLLSYMVMWVLYSDPLKLTHGGQHLLCLSYSSFRQWYQELHW